MDRRDAAIVGKLGHCFASGVSLSELPPLARVEHH
jgi:hypothetical protein